MNNKKRDPIFSELDALCANEPEPERFRLNGAVMEKKQTQGRPVRALTAVAVRQKPPEEVRSRRARKAALVRMKKYPRSFNRADAAFGGF